MEYFRIYKTDALKEFLKGWAFGEIILISCVALMIIVGAVRVDKVTFFQAGKLK